MCLDDGGPVPSGEHAALTMQLQEPNGLYEHLTAEGSPLQSSLFTGKGMVSRLGLVSPRQLGLVQPQSPKQAAWLGITGGSSLGQLRKGEDDYCASCPEV